jgi:tetratricopeptide (TPR) repeat protein
MKIVMWPSLFWNQWLQWPLGLIQQYLGVDLTTGWGPTVFKTSVTIILVLIVLEFLIRVKDRVRRVLRKEDWLEVDDVVLPKEKDSVLVDSLEAARHLERTIAPLKKAKRYDRIAEIYASLNKHKEAAKSFRKAGDRQRAAMEWALAGYTGKAARLLMKVGDYATAARFYEEKQDFRNAALAYEKMGRYPDAASA